MLQPDAVRLELTDPAAMKRHHLLGAFRHGQRDGKTVNLPRLFTQVGQAMTHHQYTALIKRQFAGQAQSSQFIFRHYRQGVSLLLNACGFEYRRTIQPMAVALDARRSKQTMAQFCHQRHRRIDVEPAICHRTRKTYDILRRKVLKMRPPVENFGKRVGFYHHVCRVAFKS